MKKIRIILSLLLSTIFLTACILCIQTLYGAKPVSATDGGLRIVLDAGHGGVDGGVSGKVTKTKESDLNLAIVLKLNERLTDMGFDVTLTRKTEAGLYGAIGKGFKRRDMQKRKEIIERTKPILVLSIHQNFYPSKSVRGGQVFYNKQNAGSLRLARIMQETLNGLYLKQGVKERVQMSGEYYMLQCAPCPSVIVECGFLSSADEALLIDEAWQKTLVNELADGVMAYFSDATA